MNRIKSGETDLKKKSRKQQKTGRQKASGKKRQPKAIRKQIWQKNFTTREWIISLEEVCSEMRMRLSDLFKVLQPWDIQALLIG